MCPRRGSSRALLRKFFRFMNSANIARFRFLAASFASKLPPFFGADRAWWRRIAQYRLIRLQGDREYAASILATPIGDRKQESRLWTEIAQFLGSAGSTQHADLAFACALRLWRGNHAARLSRRKLKIMRPLDRRRRNSSPKGSRPSIGSPELRSMSPQPRSPADPASGRRG
jgi:hypothetical protein